jgi:sulfur-carrier protein
MSDNHVTVRYWAGGWEGAGGGGERLAVDGVTTLDAVLEDVRLRHLDRPKFKDVVSVCSVLVGDRPAGTSDPAQVEVRPGDTVELLPPFAGG